MGAEGDGGPGAAVSVVTLRRDAEATSAPPAFRVDDGSRILTVSPTAVTLTRRRLRRGPVLTIDRSDLGSVERVDFRHAPYSRFTFRDLEGRDLMTFVTERSDELPRRLDQHGWPVTGRTTPSDQIAPGGPGCSDLGVPLCLLPPPPSHVRGSSVLSNVAEEAVAIAIARILVEILFAILEASDD